MSQTVTFINFINQTNIGSCSNNKKTASNNLNNESIFSFNIINDNPTNITLTLGGTSNEKAITQSLWETGDGSVVTQSLGETGDGSVVTQTLGETGDGSVVTQSLGETGDGSVVTQTLGETGDGSVVTQSLGETGDGSVVTQSLGETGGEVQYTEEERKYLDSILNNNGKIGWSEHMAFMELADTDGNGELTEAEKQATFLSLKSDSSKVTELKSKVKSIGSSYGELLNIDKNYGTNDDLKVQTDEFSQQFGSDITKLVDINGNGQISRVEYQAFVEMFDQDGDGKLLDKELQIVKKDYPILYGNSDSSSASTSSTSSLSSSSGTSTSNTSSSTSSSIKDQLKAIYNKLAKYSRQYVPMLSGQFNNDTSTTTATDATTSTSTSTSTSSSATSSSSSSTSASNTTPPEKNEMDGLDKLLDNDGTYSVLEHEAFIRYADKNNDGIISDSEKKSAMSALQNSSEAAKLKAEFDKIKLSETELNSLDKDGDGKVSKTEFAAKYGTDLADAMDLVLKTDGNIDIDELLVLTKYADTNGDGKLDADEISAATSKLNNSDRDSKRNARAKLRNIYWQDVSIRNQSYNYMT